MIPARRLRRPLRFALLAGLLVLVWLFARRYDFYRIPEADQSLAPIWPAGSRVLVEAVDAETPLARGTDVVYRMEREGVDYARFGRIQAGPGDSVDSESGYLTVDGRRFRPIALRGEALGVVPQGHVAVFAINPAERRYPDSRTLGFVPRADVRGVLVSRVAFGGP